MKISTQQIAALRAVAHGHVFAHGRDGNITAYVDEGEWRYFKPATLLSLRNRNWVQLRGDEAVSITTEGAAQLSRVSHSESDTGAH